MPYHSRKVAVRFTPDEFALLEFAASQEQSNWSKCTVSKFIRSAVKERIRQLGYRIDGKGKIVTTSQNWGREKA